MRHIPAVIWLVMCVLIAEIAHGCWIVQAWTLLPIALLGLLAALWCLRDSWRHARQPKPLTPDAETLMRQGNETSERG